MAKRSSPDRTATDLGMRIKNRRDKLKLTQEQLGAAAGVTKSSVSQWESGDVRNLKLDTFYKVVKKLGVRGRYLALGELPEEPTDRDKLPQEVIDLAKQLADLPPEKRNLLIDIFKAAVPDSRLTPHWRKPIK